MQEFTEQHPVPDGSTVEPAEKAQRRRVNKGQTPPHGSVRGRGPSNYNCVENVGQFEKLLKTFLFLN